MRRKIIGPGLALVAALLGLAPLTAANKDGAGAVRIGLVGTLFRDVPPALVQFSMKPLAALIQTQTGMSGVAVVSGDALNLAGLLNEGKVQLGVFHGVEFAWAQEKYPQLRPLVICINRHKNLKAHLVTKHDSDVKCFGDLKGKSLGLPRRSREHCHLFLERECRACGSDPKNLFSEVIAHADVEEALDGVVSGKVAAVVVDGVSLESYEVLKPGNYSGLKVVRDSHTFPAAVIAYRAGGMDKTKLARFRDGLIRAHQNTRSRELMYMWRLTAFEPVPADYQKTLTEIRKVYPTPQPAPAAQAP
ncbi:MAG: phosphate/phosphite/phosphonate ABC transporter substrate-binding protein [Gemmataceae bacterium]|nr:phosphate/phosphite/phosphonate ABC transporter substrate-binding protein [Gemmataceae bacterium]